MQNITNEERYAADIYLLFTEAFDRDNEKQKWEIESIDPTAWFTGLVMASGMLYNKFTNDDKNYIEFTHLCQNLLIQNMMEKKEAA